MKSIYGICLSAGISLFLLAGCRPGGSETPEDGPKGETPVTGDWVRLGIPNDPDRLHPYSSTHATSSYIKDQIFQFLCDINPYTLELEPVLLSELPAVSPDKMSYECRIRPEAVWDDGKPITGHDIEF